MDLSSSSHVFLVSSRTHSCTEEHGIAPFVDNDDIVFTDLGSQRLRLHHRIVTSRLLPEPEKKAIVVVHVRRFPGHWIYM